MFQAELTKKGALHHRDGKRSLFVDVDGSKKYGFEVNVYHVKGDPIDKKEFPSTDMQSMLFLPNCSMKSNADIGRRS